MPVIRCLTQAALVVLALAATGLAQQAFQWETDVEAAKRLAAQSNRLVLIHFWAPWCKPCMRLDQMVFSNPGFGPAIQNQYVAVKVNLDQNTKLAEQYGVKSIPADVILSPQGQLVQKMISPQKSADEYVGVMQQLASRNLRAPAGAYAAAQPAADGGQPQQPAAPPSVAATGNDAATPASPPADDRYSNYYGARGTVTAPVAPPYTSQAAAPTTPTESPVQSPATPPAEASTQPTARYAVQSPRYDTPPAQAPAAAPTAAAQPPVAQQPAVPPSYAAATRQPSSSSTLTTSDIEAKLPPGSPPLGLEGYCPVTLVEQKVWKLGDVHFGVIHGQRTYLFTSQAEQQRFLSNPDTYSPAMSGNDPVLAMKENRLVAGTRRHGVFYGNRIYLFSSEASLVEFSNDPGRYVPEIAQARRSESPR
jgi:thiol-disulfide isomerase/thioredoxin/YHS domain-containing protein